METNHLDNQKGNISIQPDILALKEKARQEGLETVWERYQDQQPQCGFCSLGLSCRNCAMGPYPLDSFGEGPKMGICGDDADIMVVRNPGRMVPAGVASHSDHDRDLVKTLLAVAEGKATGYQLTDLGKLDRLPAKFGVAPDLSPLYFSPSRPRSPCPLSPYKTGEAERRQLLLNRRVLPPARPQK